MLAIDSMPVLPKGVKVRYEGSIDKKGANADWDWVLYQDKNEWVIFETYTPGCIYNFVQHRYFTSAEPTFRFYFDGDEEPRFEIKSTEFGEKYPFVSPLAGYYTGPEDNGRGPIQVIRSFVPMPYQKSCKISSSVPLIGPHKKMNQGGWGHVVYHEYANRQVKTFNVGNDYSELLEFWKNSGNNPWHADKHLVKYEKSAKVNPGKSVVVFDRKSPGTVKSVNLSLDEYSREILQKLWLKISWDGEGNPSVDCPIGAFFANELGYNSIKVLMQGMDTLGNFYSYYPMPFWKSAKIELVNKHPDYTVFFDSRIEFEEVCYYKKSDCGYFKAFYKEKTPSVKGQDLIVADVSGYGKMVSGTVTMHEMKEGGVACEGDVRVYIDGNATPQVESDGSESWANYGWGFPTPPEVNPASAYDGLKDKPWSMTRLLTGDYYPFYNRLVFQIEQNHHNYHNMIESGAIFCYMKDQPKMRMTDSLDVADSESEKVHSYVSKSMLYDEWLKNFYEGDYDDVLIKDRGHYFSGYSEFEVAIKPVNRGVLLRRRTDQYLGGQKAKVYVDDQLIEESIWYTPDQNPFFRYLDTEFQIPATYTSGKEKIKVKIENIAENVLWNEYRYWVYTLKK